MTKAPATTVVLIGIKPALSDAIASMFDNAITAPAAPYFGARDGRDDDAWQAHKSPIREAATEAATALMRDALTAATRGDKITVYCDTMAFGLSDDKGQVIRWASIAEDDGWRQTGGLLRTMGAEVKFITQ